MLRTRTNDTLDVVKVDYSNLASFIYSSYKPTLIKVENIVDRDIGVFGQTLLFTPTALYTSNGKVNEYYTIFNGTILQLYRRGATTVIQRYNKVNERTFEELVKSTPTDVRLVKDEDESKLQLQLKHDSEVLSIDEGVNDLLGEKFAYEENVPNNSYNGEIYFEGGTGEIHLKLILKKVVFKSNFRWESLDGGYDVETFLDLVESGEMTYIGVNNDNGVAGVISYYLGVRGVSGDITPYYHIPASGYSVRSCVTGEFRAL